jgi:copper chaperone CopZ
MTFLLKSMSLVVLVLCTSTVCLAQSAETFKTDSLKSTTVKVKGITCSTDVKTIAGNIEKLPGVQRCKADKPGAVTSFELSYNPARVSEKEIIAAIENTGGCENPNDRPYKVKQ